MTNKQEIKQCDCTNLFICKSMVLLLSAVLFWFHFKQFLLWYLKIAHLSFLRDFLSAMEILASFPLLSGFTSDFCFLFSILKAMSSACWLMKRLHLLNILLCRSVWIYPRLPVTCVHTLKAGFSYTIWDILSEECTDLRFLQHCYCKILINLFILGNSGNSSI